MKLMYLNFCSILLVPIVANQKEILEGFREMKMTQFIDVAMYMTKRFISPKTNTLIIMEKCNFACVEHKKYHSTLLQAFLSNLNDTLTIQLFLAQEKYHPWDYNLFIVDSWSSFESLRIVLPTTEHERDFYFFILLTWGTDFMLMSNLQQIFQLCWSLSVSNVVVMAKSPIKQSIGFYTYEMVNSNDCFTSPTVKEINRYESGKLKNDFLFPKMLNNYFGCALKLSARIYQPLLTFHGDIDNKTELSEMQRLGGIEGEILKLLAESLNFTIEMRFIQEPSVINFYLNSTGCFGDLEQNLAHFAVGGFSSTIKNNEKFSKTYAHHSTSYKFVVRRNVGFSSFKQLTNPLQTTTWIFLIFTLVISMILIQVLLHVLKSAKIRNFVFGIKNKNPTFNLVLTFLGYPMPDRILPKRNFGRYILMLWLIYGLILRSSYQGKMFDTLRLGKRRPLPKTIAELIDMKYQLLAPAYTNLYPYNQTLIYKDRFTLLQQLQLNEKRLTVAVTSDTLSYYNLKNRNANTLAAVDESIFLYQCVMYFPKNSIMRESFERKIIDFTNSGISSYIAKQYVRSNFKDFKSPSHRAHRITFGNLKGIFYICGVVCFISIFIFLFELLTKKSKLLQIILGALN